MLPVHDLVSSSLFKRVWSSLNHIILPPHCMHVKGTEEQGGRKIVWGSVCLVPGAREPCSGQGSSVWVLATTCSRRSSGELVCACARVFLCIPSICKRTRRQVRMLLYQGVLSTRIFSLLPLSFTVAMQAEPLKLPEYETRYTCSKPQFCHVQWSVWSLSSCLIFGLPVSTSFTLGWSHLLGLQRGHFTILFDATFREFWYFGVFFCSFKSY